jgi:hypothetical protein
LRNAIINGNFDYLAEGDELYGIVSMGQIGGFMPALAPHTPQLRQAFTLGQTDVPGEPTYFCRTVVSSVAGAGNSSLLVQ